MLDLSYTPRLPERHDHRIAIVGAGAIVNSCHLPAYRAAGFKIAGIFDQDIEAAKRTAQQFEIQKVYSTLQDLLDDDTEVVDVAIPASANEQVLPQIARAGKHILSQKPLAEDYATCRRIIDIADSAGVRLAINMQMRWAPAIMVIHDLNSRGLLGKIYRSVYYVDVLTPWQNWQWLIRKNMIEILYHSIHYLDSIRYILGEPVAVYADGAGFPEFEANGETRSLIHLIYAGPQRATVLDNHHNQQDESDWRAFFRYEGTEGTAEANIGVLMNYPQGEPDRIRYRVKGFPQRCWVSRTFDRRWFPDAFVGPMASLLCSLETGDTPVTDCHDVIKTMRLVFACYRSIAEQRVVHLKEMDTTFLD